MDYIRYTSAIEHLYENLDKIIQDGTLNGRAIYMFGSSKVASMIIYYLKEKNIKLKGIIDNNPKCMGNIIFGLKISAPSILADTWDDKNLVLIASGHQDAMIKQLEDMGYVYGKHMIKVLDIPKEMGDYSFVDRTGYRALSDEEVRKSLLNVLRCVKTVCERNGLQYYLAYGTLLGAVRHKGFIPWDDDIDIYIPTNQLNQFIEAVKKEKGFNIISAAVGDDYYDAISLMYDRSNICDSNHFPMQISAGVTIDVFPLFGLPDDEMELKKYDQELKEAELDMLNLMYDKEACSMASKKFFHLMEKYDITTTGKIGNILSSHQLKEFFPKEWFSNGTMLEFEGEQYCVPANYDSYLHIIYDDYMQLPPEKERKRHHFFHVYQKKEL
jgi:lipopolysaccharide cholinephosphotransferase